MQEVSLVARGGAAFVATGSALVQRATVIAFAFVERLARLAFESMSRVTLGRVLAEFERAWLALVEIAHSCSLWTVKEAAVTQLADSELFARLAVRLCLQAVATQAVVLVGVGGANV